MGVITLTGSNAFLIDRTLRQYIESFRNKNGAIAIERFDGEEKEAADIISSFSSTSLFSEKKLVLLRGLARNSDLSERIDELIDKAGEDTELIIIEPKLDKRGKLYTRLKKDSEFKEFSEMHPAALATWLVKEAAERGGKISNATAKRLVDTAGANQELLSSELDKLLIYDPDITDKSVDLLVEANPHSKVFDLVDAVFKKDRQRVNKLYDEQRALKVDPNQIIGLIAWQLHLLAAIKTSAGRGQLQIAKDLGLSERAVSGSMRLASGISMSELLEMIERLLKVDCKLKQQAVDKDDALLFCLLSL